MFVWSVTSIHISTTVKNVLEQYFLIENFRNVRLIGVIILSDKNVSVNEIGEYNIRI